MLNLKPHALQIVFFGSLALLCTQSIVPADQFTLRDGRTLTGKVLSSQKIDRANPDKKSSLTDEEIVVEIDDGVQIIIHKSDLVLNGHVPIDPREIDYEKRAKGMDQSAETHLKVAGWCASKGLKELAQAHYLRAIDLNPDLKEARAAVKHTQSDSGRWIRVEEHMLAMDKVEVAGKWVYPETVQEEQQKKERATRNQQLRKSILRYHQDCLKGGPKADEAMAALEQINDPLAVEIFAEKLADKNGNQPQKTPEAMKRYYILLLSKFDSPIAVKALATTSVLDASEPIRNAALDSLSKKGRELAVQLITGLLRSQNNEIINRAAYALGKLEASEATLDLISVLSTKHEVTASQSETYSTQGMAMGGPKKAIISVENKDVLGALSQITQQGNLGYNKAAWLAWFASVYAPPVDDLRRDF